MVKIGIMINIEGVDIWWKSLDTEEMLKLSDKIYEKVLLEKCSHAMNNDKK
jgi:hypothetical protein